MSSYSSLFLLLLFFCGVSFTDTLKNGFSVELMHHDSSNSPFYNPAETRFQRVSNLVHHSINRANYFNQVFVVSPTNMPETVITPFIGYGYIMSYSIGTPPFQLYGVVDTGSNWIWFQCKPCELCYNQTSPMFDPLKSSTYRTIPCSSATCKHVEKVSCSSNNKKICEYNFSYVDTSGSQGDLSVDTITLNSTNGSPTSFPRTVIGCGHKNIASVKGLASGVSFEGKASGVIGLGGGPLSLVSQLGSSIGGKFSYCFVLLFPESNTSSKLNFGDTAVVSGPGTVSTPIAQGIINIFDLVTLEAFSVGDNIIKMGLLPGIQGNTLIDSGSTLTHLPPDIYSKLESAVAALINLKRVKDPTHQLSLCYETTSKELEVPVITAHFNGADVQLNALNTFIPVDHRVVCFAFAPIRMYGLVVYGNIAQQNFLVGFDFLKKIISFKPTDCTRL